MQVETATPVQHFTIYTFSIVETIQPDERQTVGEERKEGSE